MRSVLLTCAVFAILASAGCGKSGPKGVPVSGRVTLDKRPVVGAWVTFSPMEKTADQPDLEGTGQTDNDGKYSLKGNKDPNRVGVPAGTYRVHISLIDRESKTGKMQQLPAVYNTSSKLTFPVPDEGSTAANFDLSSTGK
jgi:hypothetical protein